MQAVDIDTTPTKNSNNLITSGGVEASIKATKIEIDTKLNTKQNNISGTSGQLVTIDTDGNVTTKNVEDVIDAHSIPAGGTKGQVLPDSVSKATHIMQTSIRVRDTTIVFPVITGNWWYTEDGVTKAKITFTAYNPTEYEISSIYVVAQVIFIEK